LPQFSIHNFLRFDKVSIIMTFPGHDGRQLSHTQSAQLDVEESEVRGRGDPRHRHSAPIPSISERLEHSHVFPDIKASNLTSSSSPVASQENPNLAYAPPPSQGLQTSLSDTSPSPQIDEVNNEEHPDPHADQFVVVELGVDLNAPPSKAQQDYDSATTHSPAQSSLPTTDEPTTNVNFTHRQILIVFIALFCCISISSLDISITGIAAPAISAEFNDFQNFVWIGSGYLAAQSACTPLYGTLSDMYGRRFMMEIALFFFSLGSVICALSTSMMMLIIGRGVQGSGGAGLSSMVMTIVGDIVAPADRGKYQGILGSAFGIFSVAG
jgi:hypothetical protein